MSAFSSLVDCEGSVNWYGLKRIIRVRMKEKEYLLQWSKLLKKHGIYNYLRENKNEWELNLAGWEDFDRLEKKGFLLHHSKKAKKWKEIMNGFKRNQISRGSYKKFYIRKLKNMGKGVTSKEFAMKLNKSERVVSHYLLKLKREGLIKCDKSVWPYLYFIST